MSLVDLAQPEFSTADAANQIREHLAGLVGAAEAKLQQVRNLVRQYGRAAISSEFGSDAQSMLTVYNKLKEAIEVAKETIVEDLP